MATLTDPGVRELLEQPNYAVISTVNPNGSIHTTIVWVDVEDDTLAVNSAAGRLWPSNLERDPRIGVLVYASPFHFVEIRGTARSDFEDAEDHADRLAIKYTGEKFTGRQPGTRRIKFNVIPEHVRYVKQD
ncbi:MAG TPA: pyridoxamine 5'-phosphate oxidase family protein [Solirubrobacteraceae bacterium]|jgi:PPOX class probable F420-dependent enzyme